KAIASTVSPVWPPTSKNRAPKKKSPPKQKITKRTRRLRHLLSPVFCLLPPSAKYQTKLSPRSSHMQERTSLPTGAELGIRNSGGNTRGSSGPCRIRTYDQGIMSPLL